jgi:DNA-directed RNA polymerase subunit RPC12/RpoP
MADILQKCSVCSGLIDEEDLFCANCGAESPNTDVLTITDVQTVTRGFDCSGCGASMTYDASAQSLRCPFCGSESLEEQPDKKSIAPRRVVPFAQDRDSAIAIMRKWLGRGFWRPSDLSQTAAVTKITAVYVPYWVFTAKTFTYWTADSSQTPSGARGDWVPLSGEHRGNYSGVLIGASGVLTPGETTAICPFDLAAAVPPEQVDLDNTIVEQFRVQRKYARPKARQGLENLEAQACLQHVPGRHRNMQVNLRIEGLSSEAVLFPVWVMAYTYQERVFRFLVNGQTGKSAGQAPTSWKKIVVAIVLAILAILLVLGLIGVIGASVSSREPRSAETLAFRTPTASAMMPEDGTYAASTRKYHGRWLEKQRWAEPQKRPKTTIATSGLHVWRIWLASEKRPPDCELPSTLQKSAANR